MAASDDRERNAMNLCKYAAYENKYQKDVHFDCVIQYYLCNINLTTYNVVPKQVGTERLGGLLHWLFISWDEQFS